MHFTNFNNNPNGKLLLDKFPTIRLHDKQKFYEGAEHGIFYKKILIATAEVVEVVTKPFGELTNYETLVDSGMINYKFIQMFNNFYKPTHPNGLDATTKIDLVVFKYIKKTAHTYEAMVAEWWNNVKEQISFQDPFLSA